MESEEYLRRMYEQNGVYNLVNTLDYPRNYSLPYVEKIAVAGDVQAINVALAGINNEAGGINIQHQIKQHQQPHQGHQQSQIHEQEHQQHHEQHQQQHQQQQQISNLKTYWMNQRKHFNPLGELAPPPSLKIYENGPPLSALSVSTSMNLEYIPNNSLSLTPMNLHRYPTIPQRYSPEPTIPQRYSPDGEPPKIYPTEPLKSYNQEPHEIYNPQPHIVLNSQHPKVFNQESPQIGSKLKLIDSELRNMKNIHLEVHLGRQVLKKIKDHTNNQEPELEGVESNSHDDPYIESTGNSVMGDQGESLDKKDYPRVRQEMQCLNKVKNKTDNKEPETEEDKLIVQLVAATSPLLNVIRWLQQHQLLKNEMKCDHCEIFMAWKTCNSDKKWTDGFVWKCENRNCPTRYCSKTIRAGTFFAGSKLCLKKWLHIMYKWIKNVGVTAASEQVLADRQTTCSYYSFFREVCGANFKANPIKLGGPGISIEMDVTCFAQKRKRNHGRDAQPPSWVLGILDSNSNPSIGYTEIIDTTDVAILLPTILKVVQPGSIIHTKEWRAYTMFQNVPDKDGIVNQSVNFVDVTSVQKQTIELYWNNVKSFLAARKGSRSKSALYSYLQEFMWRERFSQNALEILCEQIAFQYCDASYIDKKDNLSFEGKTEKQENYLKMKLGEDTNGLEMLSDKKYQPRDQQESHSIFQDILNDSNTPDDSCIDNTDSSCTKDKIEKHTNNLEVPPPKMCDPEVQQGRQFNNKVIDYTNDQEPKPEDDNVIMLLFAEKTPNLKVIRWLQQYQLLKSKINCDHCESFMVWKNCNNDNDHYDNEDHYHYCKKQINKWKDGSFWQCENRNCPTHYCTKSIRAMSFFARSQLCLKKWLHIMYKWSKNVGVTEVSNLGITDHTSLCTCYGFFREVCETYFKANPITFGGPGVIIEINVYCFTQKRKINCGQEALPPTWVLVIVDTNCSPSIGYIEIVNNTDVSSLSDIILKVVKPGSIIHSKNYEDITINHSVSVIFVDINTSVDRQKIDSYWKKLNIFLAVRKGSKQISLNSYLQEFMWRERFSENAFEILCEQIAIQNFDDTNIDKTDGSSLDNIPEKQENYLETNLGENKTYLESSCVKKVKDSVENQECKTVGEKLIVPPVAATKPIVDVIKWFQEHQLLENKMKCDHCKYFMSWKTNDSYTNKVDGFIWKCENKNCPTSNSTKSIRAGSFFFKSLISLPKWFDIMYLWSKHVGGAATSNQINISRAKILECYSFFREVCNVYFKESPIKLGGPAKTLVIDVSCFSNSKKRKRNPEPQSPIWVLGIVDINQKPSIGYMEIVETRDVFTLLPLILKVVQPGTIIHSKEWEAYREIQGLFYTDGTVKHSVNFVDLKISVHKQMIESYWNKHKSYIAAIGGSKRSRLNSYLQEFMWRERFSNNALEILSEQIAVQSSNDSYNEIKDGSVLLNKIEKQESDLDPSCSDNTDDSCSEEDVGKHTNYLEVILEENVNYVEKPSTKMCSPRVRQGRQRISKVKGEKHCNAQTNDLNIDKIDGKCHPRVQQGRQCRNNVKNYSDDLEAEPVTKQSNVPDDSFINNKNGSLWGVL